MGFFEKINGIWRNIGLVQRAVLLAMVLTFVIACVLLGKWASRPDFALLYQDVSAEEAAKITDKLLERGIEYKLSNSGGTILAPRKEIYQLRLDMAKDGLPGGGDEGYKIFDNEKIGISPFVQNVNLQRALQDELAKSIEMMDGVLHARIHIVSAKKSLLGNKSGETSASVALRVKPGYRISSTNVAAITHLVAGAVEGLEPENITVVDSKGVLLSRQKEDSVDQGASTVAEFRERVEQNLSRKAEDMLMAVLGPGKAVVEVSAILDMTRVNTIKESYDPSGKVAMKEEITSNSETESTRVSAEGTPATQGGVKKDETIVTEYKVGKTVEERVQLPGEVVSLSVAAFVDLTRGGDPNAEGAEAGAKLMTVADVQDILTNALGLKEADSLKVVETVFQKAEEPFSEDEAGSKLDIMAIAGQASLGIMAICALLVLKMFSGGKKGAAGAGEIAQLGEGSNVAGLLSGSGQVLEPGVLRQQISSAMRQNPEQVKQLFSSWVNDGGGGGR